MRGVLVRQTTGRSGVPATQLQRLLCYEWCRSGCWRQHRFRVRQLFRVPHAHHLCRSWSLHTLKGSVPDKFMLQTWHPFWLLWLWSLSGAVFWGLNWRGSHRIPVVWCGPSQFLEIMVIAPPTWMGFTTNWAARIIFNVIPQCIAYYIHLCCKKSDVLAHMYVIYSWCSRPVALFGSFDYDLTSFLASSTIMIWRPFWLLRLLWSDALFSSPWNWLSLHSLLLGSQFLEEIILSSCWPPNFLKN